MKKIHAESRLNRSRAAFELQLGSGFVLKDATKTLGYAVPVEFLDDARWQQISGHSPALFLTAARADRLGLPRRVAHIDVASLSLPDLWQLVAGAKAAAPRVKDAPDFTGELLGLAKQAGILPALVWLPTSAAPSTVFSLDVSELTADGELELLRGENVRLPLKGAEDSTITSFREQANVHLALMVGADNKNVPLVRVHSSCVTGDLLGSLRCDCGDQLQGALSRMKNDGLGILLYLHQEGRGIGITSKLRAYALQEQGFDTFEANRQLGFEEDERDFAVAAAMLSALGHTKIRLLTNNPDKVNAFATTGITVVERVPLLAQKTEHNEAYIEAKHAKRGHLRSSS